MTFIRNLNRQRHAATVGGAGAVENGDKAKVDGGQPAGAKEPELRGPFRIPLGTMGVAVLAFIPFVVFCTVIAISFLDGEYGKASAGAAIGAMLFGVPWYFVVRRVSAR